MPCSLCVLTERAVCLPRQVYLLSTDHGDILATVERIGNDFDGISRCASVPPRSHEACWLKAHNRSLPVCRHPRRLVPVTDILRLSIRTTGSRRGRRLDVAMLVAAPGCVAMPCLCIGTEAATGENSFDACALRVDIVRTGCTDDYQAESVCVRGNPTELCSPPRVPRHASRLVCVYRQ